MLFFRSIMLTGVLSACLTGPVLGQSGELDSRGFDPRQPCGKVLQGASDMDKMMVAAWAFGYLGGSGNGLRPVDLANNRVILRNLIEGCLRDTERPLVALLQTHTTGDAGDPGSEENARALLMKFLQPGADLAALTAELKPSEADIRAVYGPPLSDLLITDYARMFTPGVAIGPKPDQNALLTSRATTASLKRGDAVLRDFPGGYKDVLEYFIGDHPIIRFKFVTQGETMGMAFDGLIFVNGRWVLMPKPWRSLK